MRRRIFFICGSMNQTTQMHQISEHLTEYEHSFSPYYCDGPPEILRRLGLIEFTIAGNKLAERCRGYLQNHGLPVDYQGKNGPYDLVVTCSDLLLPRNIRDNRIVLVQEGITDPESRVFHFVKRLRFLPRWLAGTSTTGLSDGYSAFCVASEGYRDFFIRKGVRREKIVVTGIPNFDECRRYCSNDFPYRHYVLACTSPLREIFRRENRKAFIGRAVELAGRRPLVFKLHRNENIERATREICRHARGAMVFSGPNYMVGNACASGNAALLCAIDLLRAGRVDAVVVSAATQELDPVALQGWALMNALVWQSFTDAPAHASRPFDARRQGFVPGEGAGAVILETLAGARARGARARGARIHAELLGGVSTCDATRLPSRWSKARCGSCVALCARRASRRSR